MLLKLTILPGDGIGPEVIEGAICVLKAVAHSFHHELDLAYSDVGGAALLSSKEPLPLQTLQTCLSSTAVLLGAVGAPAFDDLPGHLRPEAGLLKLRRQLGAFANLRPAVFYPSLAATSPLRPEVADHTDILIVRELLSGLYFGEPRLIQGRAGDRDATNTMRYREPEIERVARVAFELAQSRRRKLTSVDKANVLECSRLWRDVVTRVARDFPDVTLAHMYVDSAAMALVMHPAQFDVVLTENMFGDILSDEVGGIVGSLGLLASASIGGPIGLYEPVHGSAPNIAGKGIANPLGAILSVALLLRYSFRLEKEAACIEWAVGRVLERGDRTADLAPQGAAKPLTTTEMAHKVAESALELASEGGLQVTSHEQSA
ncbi:MAG TPA: 3-isopropylmalate dehydrogenase [Terriglobales bacterium]|nr:3-isopropylmalate dehydrogenase [Terriglobales bacterium]